MPRPPEPDADTTEASVRTEGPVRLRPRSRRLAAWTGIGGLLFLLGAAWAAAMPLMAAPDEPSHVLYAAALARGQWDGELGPAPEDTSRPGVDAP